MWTLLLKLMTPRALIAAGIVAALSVTHTWTYRSGSASVRQKWDAAITTQALATAKASEDARIEERAISDKLRKANDDLQLEKRRRAADAVRAADGLRDFRATLYDITPSNPATPSGNHGAGSVERELLGSCAAALAGMAGEADRLAGKVVGLQEYLKAVAPVKP